MTNYQLHVSPSTIGIRLGETATFDALHAYVGQGNWIVDENIDIMEKTSKRIVVRPVSLGSFTITYKIGEFQNNATLYVTEQATDMDFADPVEEAPPEFEDLPPQTPSVEEDPIKFMEPWRDQSSLFKYPNIMKRNSRYRGQRESEKFLNDHQEQIYDIRHLYKDLEKNEYMKCISINTWFKGISNAEKQSIFAKSKENDLNSSSSIEGQETEKTDAGRAFNSDVIQLSGNRFEDHMMGIFHGQRRLQQLNERIAEAERRYKEYENAYE
ncbi:MULTISPECIES: hypothetical protein [Bacillus subtilis group]|uniref:hypothetical protein n=1 Tax=Bacillus subtilis group TaxID=653685 RepID=UPI0009B7D7ED|nr:MULTISPECIES: hypothetical protein [Bacillus subtilis group]ARC67397.1 hypothetical protein B14_200186 [Bacillus licheniformis]ARW46194.1 hypothetical protein S100141_04976 [Bacillus licheniformis]MDE1421827.1 hypothetical protein [Bacillus licheniformis]MEC0475832.1 hypothetical protein [Bacillus licheniformis]MED4337991.1 hypothetical protein [Bacillus licheniformis]